MARSISFRNAVLGTLGGIVAVILNLAVWFAVHVLFGRVTESKWRGLHWLSADPASLDFGAAAIALVAVFWLFVVKRGMLETLGLAVVCGVVWRFAVGSS